MTTKMAMSAKYCALLGVSLLPIIGIGSVARAQAASETELNEVIVTATRQSERLSRVPISVAAFTPETMDKFGVKQVDDLVRLTPGLSMSRSVTGANTISIRGISSAAGAGVTGVYIDDTPIQVRNQGYGSGTAFPEVFDLERIEVLRGPQGTLFGAGSEGGTVRFIQAKPVMTGYSAYARAEVAHTERGDWTYEGGVAVGGAIVEDKIGFRGNVYYRREGGYVDGVEGVARLALNPANPAQPPAAIFPNGNLVDFTRTATVRPDTNRNEAFTARLAVEIRPTEQLTLTPSVSYQKLRANDGTGGFWTSTSDISRRDYSRLVYTRGDPATNPALTPIDISDEDEGRDRFVLPALAANLDLGFAELITNTAYFDRKSSQWFDFTRIDAVQFAGVLFPDQPGFKASSLYEVAQKNFVQELRLQSTDRDAQLRWIVGGFYSKNKQNTDQAISDNFLGKLPAVFGVPANGPPFGPGASAVVNALGVPLLPNEVDYAETRRLTETQYAAFGQVDFHLTEKLTLTGGLRVSRNELTFTGIFRGPLNNDNVPFGAPCPSGPTCVVGQPPFEPVYQDTLGFKTAETSVTPKVGVSYQATPNDLFYATVSKGFRPAGVSPRVPRLFCGPDLQTTGYLAADGSSAQPINYGSDSVWSYEVGAKNRMMGGRLSIDASAYYIDWTNIQTRVFLPTCLYDFVDNLGKAKSRGFDLAIQAEPIENLQLGATVGYNDAQYAKDVVTPGGVVLFRKGAPIEASRPWTATVSGQYDWRRYYARADFSYFTQARRSGDTDARSPLYNPQVRPDEAYGILNARIGARVGDADISLFVDNLTNEAPIFDLGREIGGSVYTANTLRPRTVGVTVSYRH